MTCRLILFLLPVLMIAMSCASRGVPGGGPVDRTPPEILATEPVQDSTGINELEEIVILFSERMDESTVQNAIFISPPLAYEMEWSGGDEITLIIQDTLRRDVTYVVTVGSGASDSRRNRMAQSYQFAFSTGGTIQRGQINGLVYDISEKDPFYVYAYLLSGNSTEEVDPSKQPADFFTQPGADGAFSLSYLGPGIYRIFIVEDQNRNFILDSDYERVGIPVRDAVLDSARNYLDQLYFRITRIDTIPPQITGARALNRTKILVRLSEPVSPVDQNAVTIRDKLKGNVLNIRNVIPNKQENNQYFIFTDEQVIGSDYQLQVVQLCDTSGNCQDSIQFADFSAAADSDTVTFRILKIIPEDSAKNVAIERPVEVQLSKAVDSVSFDAAFIIQSEPGDTIPASWQWDNLETGYLNITHGFNPGYTYRFALQSKKIRSVWGDTLIDTTISRIFSTRTEDDFGSLSGIVNLPAIYAAVTKLFIKTLAGRSSPILLTPGIDKMFRAPWLPEGKYILGGYIDLNQDYKYSYGNIYPFEYAEPYYIIPDTISIRKRWEVSDIEFLIPELEIQ